MIFRVTISPTLTVVTAGSKERTVEAVALLFVCWLCWATNTKMGIVTRIMIMKPSKNIFLYDEKMDISIPEFIVYRKKDYVNPRFNP